MAPKSILKKSAHGTSAEERGKQQRAREIAIYHANIIQRQKDVENDIFQSLEDLIDFPLTEGATSENPSSSDIQAFQMLAAPFRPQDFDELILERNMAQKCGYVFCPNEPRPNTHRGKSRILGKSSVETIKIVDASKVTRWCSDDCAVRAVHIKVQLKTEPAWLRVEEGPAKIVPLTGDVNGVLDLTGTDRLGSDLAQLRKKMDQLALEHGDQDQPAKSGVMSSGIVEKSFVRAPEAPTIGAGDMHENIEGYQPQTPQHRELGDGDWDD